MTGRSTRLWLVALLAIAAGVLLAATGCGDDDNGDGDATVERIQIEFVDLPPQQRLTVEIAAASGSGSVAFDSASPKYGGELSPNNVTDVGTSTLEMQTFAPLGRGTLTIGVDVASGVDAIQLSVIPVPEGSEISAGVATGELSRLQGGTVEIDLTD